VRDLYLSRWEGSIGCWELDDWGCGRSHGCGDGRVRWEGQKINTIMLEDWEILAMEDRRGQEDLRDCQPH
jgi:hypothetical protein